MRIAVIGSHRVGKTTLAHAIAHSPRHHHVVDEPYHELVAAGHAFADPPDVDDFEAQLEVALDALTDDAPAVIFDRAPLDLFAYLAVASGNDERILAPWRERVRQAMHSLDALICVPVEAPDVIDVAHDEDAGELREAVDATLREMLSDGDLTADVAMLDVSGSPGRRTRAALAWLAELG